MHLARIDGQREFISRTIARQRRQAGHDFGLTDRKKEQRPGPQGFNNIDLTNNELAKTHLRYMIGGRSAEATRERLFRFWFPERPGALTQFLADMGADWNISLFQYRNQGGQFGRVLIGLEIPAGEEKKLQKFLAGLGYRFVEETDDPAYRLFL